ncbi:hypothetical protein BH10BDE1_BH10BDE1_03000 [soil metagenome]
MMKLLIAVGLFVAIVPASYAAPDQIAVKTAKVKAKTPVKPAVKPLAKTPPKKATTRQQDEDQAIARNISLIDFANDRLEYLRGDEVDCPACLASTAGTGYSSLDGKDGARVCKEKWTDFYSNEPVDVRIVFGYQDSDDDSLAGDVLQRQAMVDRITSKCAEDNLVQACDFTRSPDDADVFERDIRGPDAKMHKMRVRLTASSYSSSDAVNKAFSSEQEAKTEQSKKIFYEGLKKADMLLYVGHARGGGGPDFKPARRNEKGKIDYAYYREPPPGVDTGVDELTKALMDSDRSPKILGFFACESEAWRTRLSRYAPKSGLILSATPKMPLEVGVAQAFAALDSAIWQRCGESFDKALNFNPEPGEQMKYGATKLVPIKLTNFMKK